MTMEGQGEHRWIGFIVFKDQSTITYRFIKCKKTDSVGTIVSRVWVRTIGGSSYLWRPELPPSTPEPDIYIPVDGTW